ncbi:MAG: acyl-CoA dehydrogenase [Hydrogenophilaceae bacterium]|jgi:acyl-CoA dehydrogenase|nr:acyl-CoA dehydrogenase [Hydrogenophilaceae bacterium]
MSESQNLLLESAERVFADLAPGAAVETAWGKIAELGFDGLLVPESSGGFGGDWADAFAVLRRAGAHATPLPLGEAMAATRLAVDAGFDCGAGILTLASRVIVESRVRDRFTGRLEAVPWGGDANAVVFDLGGALASAAVAKARVVRGANPAGEARATLIFEDACVQRGEGAMSALSAGALVRTAQIAGALDAALEMSVRHANERSQFGKPIGKFQAVQQALAVFAEEAAAVNCAGQAAARAADHDGGAFEIAAAKLRANMAAAVGAAIAHQVHGAIGFTQEHPLHRLTRRLVAWRSEFGGERVWAERLGAEICARGADALWPFLTARGDAAQKERR